MEGVPKKANDQIFYKNVKMNPNIKPLKIYMQIQKVYLFLIKKL